MLILARHAETDWNKPPSGEPEILRGGFDVPLNDAGRAEAVKAGQQLCDFKISYIASSSFSRDAETGRLMAEQCGAQFVLDEAMAPWNIGSLAGKYRRDVHRLADWFITHPDTAVPGGEPYRSFYNRFKQRFLAALRDSDQDPSRTIVLIGQGNSFRALPAILASVRTGSDDFSLVENTAENLKTMDMAFF